ncbi:Crp/Fnr family transcriptional regulator [Thiosulfativibrio zosterae]|nr:Crp/Fnr family transcriptional regulator [Thiosulfativibrio zosterae]
MKLNNTHVTLSLLKQINLLAGLSDAALEAIIPKIKVLSLSKGEYLFHKGAESSELYFLLNGSLQVLDYTPEGQLIGLAVIRPGWHVGEMAVLDDEPRSASIMAEKDSELLYLSHKHALELFTHEPIVALRVMRGLVSIIRKDNNVRAIIAIPNAKVRVYRYLMSIATEVEGEMHINNLPKHSALASICNTSRETVSRALSELQKNQIASKLNTHDWVIDASALELFIENIVFD